ILYTLLMVRYNSGSPETNRPTSTRQRGPTRPNRDARSARRGAMSCLRLAVLLLLIGGSAAAAQTTSGSMSGSVVDESSQAVPGATITIANEATGEERTTQST